MPIAPKYTWWETPDHVCIRLEGAPIKDQSQVFCSDAVVKVNAPPYFLLLDLHGEVDEERSAAALHGGSTVLKLQKRVAGTWGRLAAQGDKAALQQRREASIHRAHAKAQQVRQERLARKQRESKEASERQSALERRKRSEIEARKAQELQQERSQLASWQHSLGAKGQQQPAETGQPLLEGGWQLGCVRQLEAGDESDYEEDIAEGDADGAQASSGARDQCAKGGHQHEQQQGDHEDYHGRGWWPAKAAAGAGGDAAAAIWGSAASNSCSDDEQPDAEQQQQEEEEEEEEEKEQEEESDAGEEVQQEAAARVSHAPVRAALASVKVSFTATETHMPARETREAEIREYKRKSHCAQQLGDSADVSDRQPAFLKDKGDALYAQHNYRGAINAYSRALELDDSLPALWANRAACHLQLGNHAACAADCDAALALLRSWLEGAEQGSAADDDGKLRRLFVKVLARRGAARAAAGQLQLAAEDLQEALRHDPGNASLASDLSEVLASTAPADAATLRARGDARFKAGDHSGAAQAYTLLLQLPAGPQGACEADRLAALANRAACWLPLQWYRECVEDCTAALEGTAAAAAAEAGRGDAGAAGTSFQTPSVPGDAGSGNNAAEGEADGSTAEGKMAAGSSSSSSSSSADLHAAACCRDRADAAAPGLPFAASGNRQLAPSSLCTWLLEHAEQLGATGCTARLASAARLVARRAAAHSYLKQYGAAAADYAAAQQLYANVLGDAARAEQLGRDLQEVLQRQATAVGQAQGQEQAAHQKCTQQLGVPQAHQCA